MPALPKTRTSLLRLFAATLLCAAPLSASGSDDELELRLKNAIDLLEAEGEVAESDLEALREAAENPRSHCAFLDAWFDEPVCAEGDSAAEGKSVPVAAAFRAWRRTTGESRASAEFSAGPFSAFWEGSDGKPWLKRGAGWNGELAEVEVGNARSRQFVDRGNPRRAENAGSGEEFLDPGATWFDGLFLKVAPGRRARVAPFVRFWDDSHEAPRAGRRFGIRGLEAGLSGEVRAGRASWELAWNGEWTGGRRTAAPERPAAHRAHGVWNSPNARLWASWSPAPDSAFDGAFGEWAGALLLTRPGHRLELAALGDRWASADWRWPGARSVVRNGYRYARGPLLSVAASDLLRTGPAAWTLFWNAARADSTTRWRAKGSVARAEGVWRPGAEVLLRGSGCASERRLSPKLDAVFSDGFSLGAKAGPVWKGETCEEASAGTWSGLPGELSWAHRWTGESAARLDFRWKLRWNDLARGPSDAQLVHSSGLRWRNGSAGFELLWPLGGDPRDPAVRADVGMSFGRGG